MKRVIKYAATIVAVCTSVLAFAQPANIDKKLFLASGIPDSLKQDAHAVLRYGEKDVVFKSASNVVVKTYKVITILDEKGDYNALFGTGYEKKYNTIGSIWMKVYDADGKLIKKYGRSDMYDRSASDDMTIVTDDRFLVMRHAIATYPVTIETYYETDYSSFVNMPPWPIQSPDMGVESTALNISVNPAMGFRYIAKNCNFKPVESAQDGYQNYVWQIKNLKAFHAEEGVPSWDVQKKILFATNQFQFFGIPGDFSSWDSYGKLFRALNSDVCTLSDQRVEEIKAMTANLANDKEKARFLYNYMQHNTRYVSIQLGIGGFKPFPAMFVDQKKYGDCKALSNYMYALLKAVGIKSYYAIINAGTNAEPANDKFVFDSFNHAILCVPFKNDTTWLECTSSTQPFGKLGTFTENRKALLVTENGGVLVNTPKSSINDNTFEGFANITLMADGSAKAKVDIKATGGYRDTYVGLDAIKAEEKKEYLLTSLAIKQPTMFVVNNKEDKDGVKELEAEIEYDKFSDVAVNDKFFYRPRVFDLWRVTLPAEDKRKADYYFEHPMHKSCTTTIDLPDGFEVENLPTNVDLKFSYGNYNVSYTYDKPKNRVIGTAVFNLTAQKIPAAKYPEMQEYMSAIAKAQSKKLVIHKKAS